MLACEEKTIVDGTEHSERFKRANVLIDSCDDTASGRTYNYWAAPDGASGDAAFFTIDLGCQKCVSNVTLRNSRNGPHNDR